MKIMLVNGINTKPREASEARAVMERILGRNVALFYNQTCGLAQDLVESFWGRWFFWAGHTKLAHNLADQVARDVVNHGHVTLVGHSQGTIVTNNAVRILLKTAPSIRSKVNLVWFAPVVRFPVEGVHIEIWENADDSVVNLMDRPWLRGPDFERDGRGHNLIHDYLNKIQDFPHFQVSNFWRLRDIE